MKKARKDRNLLRLAIAQINTCVGDLAGNTRKIISYIDQACAKNCDIVTFPELAVCGYPPEDLLFRRSFIKENLKCLARVKERAGRIIAVVGFVDYRNGCLFNSVAVLAGRKVVDIYHKRYLPNYGVFDEKRYFTKGNDFRLYEVYGCCFGVNICEDIWAGSGVVNEQADAGAGLILTSNASPYHTGKIALRQKLIMEQAKENNVFIAYANLVGGQDELVFDGRSMVVSAKGKITSRAYAFKEDLSIVDINLEEFPRKRRSKHIKVFLVSLDRHSDPVAQHPVKLPALPERQEIFEALILGTRDYVTKNSFQKVVLGLSGGIDSSLVAAIAVEAIGKDNVTGVIMPTRFNSRDSYDDALALATNLGIDYKVIPIQELFERYLQILEPQFQGRQWSEAEENLQARIRGNILMALSNKFGWLVLTTGNKSEMSVGYATLYGDMAGGFAVLKDVPKTVIYELAELYNASSGRDLIPRRVFGKAPTAELKENQKDSDVLPEYGILDSILKYYVEDGISVSGIIQKGAGEEIVLKVSEMVDKSEYKRRQSPPGIKITPRAFGRDRRMPITNKFREGDHV